MEGIRNAEPAALRQPRGGETKMTERHRILLDLIRRQEQFKLRVRRPLDPKVMKYIEEGKPFVAINDDGVLCLLCGKHFTTIGSHFSARHGIPSGRSHTERQLLYGLVQAARLASLAVRKNLRDLALMGIIARDKFTKGQRAGSPPKKCLVPQSDRQIENHSAQATLVRLAMLRAARTERTKRHKVCSVCGKGFDFRAGLHQKLCSRRCGRISLNLPKVSENCISCGTEFSHKRFHRRKFCSRHCARVYVMQQRLKNMTAEDREQMKAKMAGMRAARRPTVAAEKLYGNCLECGNKFMYSAWQHAKLCGRRCAAIYNNRERLKRATPEEYSHMRERMAVARLYRWDSREKAQPAG